MEFGIIPSSVFIGPATHIFVINEFVFFFSRFRTCIRLRNYYITINSHLLCFTPMFTLKMLKYSFYCCLFLFDEQTNNILFLLFINYTLGLTIYVTISKYFFSEAETDFMIRHIIDKHFFSRQIV